MEGGDMFEPSPDWFYDDEDFDWVLELWEGHPEPPAHLIEDEYDPFDLDWYPTTLGWQGG
jgi:alpha-mannosidase